MASTASSVNRVSMPGTLLERCLVDQWGTPANGGADSRTVSLRPSRRTVGHSDAMRRAGTVMWRTLKSFYDDQMTHHAAALTYYSLMSLFPARAAGAVAARPARPVPQHLRRDHRLPARRRPGIGGRRRSTARCARRCRPRARRRRRWRSASWSRSTGRRACSRRPAARSTSSSRSTRRAQLPAAQDDRRGVHGRADGARARQPRHGLRRRPLRRGPAGLHRPRSDRRRGLEHRSLAGGGRSSRCWCSPSSTT